MRQKIREIIKEMADHFLKQGMTPANEMVFAEDDIERVVNRIALVVGAPEEPKAGVVSESEEEMKKKRDEAIERVEKAKQEFIKKFGECEKIRGGVHQFNHIVDEKIRACMGCGLELDTSTMTLKDNG